MPEASSQDSAPVSKHRLGRNTSGLARPSQVFDSSPALEQQKWQTYFTSCCVWITSRAFSRFSVNYRTMSVGATFDETGSAVLDRSTALAWSMVLAERLRQSVADTSTVSTPPTPMRPTVPTTCAP